MTRGIRVLELRSVRGTGGGPEKTILNGAARAASGPVAVTVCYLRDNRDEVFGIDTRAQRLPIDYVEIRERHSFDRAIWPALLRLVRERQIDIVHAHDYKTDALALALARATGVRPLATAHGWTGDSWKERRVYYPADKRLLRWFPRVVAVSSEIRDALLEARVPAGRITTIPNGIDPDAFRRHAGRIASARAELGLCSTDIALGSVGRLESQKRFDLLIEAFGRLRGGWPQLRLFIAGDGSLRAPLAAQIERLGMPGAVRLLGHRNDVIELHHALDLFVQSSDYEGTPNTVLEAMALETPVVTTDAGGTTDLVTDGVDSLVVRCGDVAALAAAIERVLEDRAAGRDRAAAARARVEDELSFERRMQKLDAVYQDLLAAS